MRPYLYENSLVSRDVSLYRLLQRLESEPQHRGLVRTLTVSPVLAPRSVPGLANVVVQLPNLEFLSGTFDTLGLATIARTAQTSLTVLHFYPDVLAEGFNLSILEIFRELKSLRITICAGVSFVGRGEHQRLVHVPKLRELAVEEATKSAQGGMIVLSQLE